MPPVSTAPDTEPRAPLWRIIALLLGVLALMVAYYWGHKPLDANQALYIGGALLDLATVGALFAVGGAFGRTLLDRVLGQPGSTHPRLSLTAGERIALDGVFGLGGIALLALGCGLLGIAVGREFWLGLLAAALILRHALMGWLRDLGAVVRAARPQTMAEGAAALYIAVLLALALVYALNPPTRWDSLTYHLVGAARTLRDGRLLPAPDNPYLGFPENMEMLFRIVMSLFGRDTAPALVHYGFGIFGLLTAAGVARRAAGRGAGWLTVLLLIGAFNVWGLFRWAYVDLGVFACGALALMAARAWGESANADRHSSTHWRANTKWLVVLGALCGLAVGFKYTGGLLALGVGVFLLLQSPRSFFRDALIAGAAALIVFAPWMIKGLLLYGNPIYPFVFGGLEWDAERAALFAFSHRNLIADGQAWQLPILPFAATVFGAENGNGFGFTAGAWLLTAWALLLLVWRWTPAPARRLARHCAAFLVPIVIAWGIMSALSIVGQQTRLVMMALPIFAVAGAMGFVGLAHFPRKPVYIGFIVRALFAATLLLNALDVVTTVERDRAVDYALGFLNLEEWRYQQTGAYANAMQHLADLPAGSRVRFLWEPRGYYCPPSVICNADLILDYGSRPQLASGTPDAAALIAAYREADDYWLVFDSGYEAALAESVRFEIDSALPAFLETYMTPVWTDGLRYTVWTWRDAR